MFLGPFLGLSIIIDLQSEVSEDFISVVAILIHMWQVRMDRTPIHKGLGTSS